MPLGGLNPKLPSGLLNVYRKAAIPLDFFMGISAAKCAVKQRGKKYDRAGVATRARKVTMNRFEWERAVVSEHGPVNPTTRHVLLTLATHANERLQAWPSILTQATETGLSERAVRTHLEIAVQEGWLMRAYVGNGKAWRNYRYTLITPPTVAERAARGSGANSVDRAARGSTANDSVVIFTGGAAPAAPGAERHSDGAAPDDIMVRNNVPTNMECSALHKTLKEVNIEKRDFIFSDSNPKTQHAKTLSRTTQALASLGAMTSEIWKEPRLQEKGPVAKAAELGLHRLEGEGTTEYIQRINEAWAQHQKGNS